MMLPSGNDAAYTIAQNMGKLLKITKYGGCSEAATAKIKSFEFRKNVIKFFLHEMNL